MSSNVPFPSRRDIHKRTAPVDLPDFEAVIQGELEEKTVYTGEPPTISREIQRPVLSQAGIAKEPYSSLPAPAEIDPAVSATPGLSETKNLNNSINTASWSNKPVEFKDIIGVETEPSYKGASVRQDGLVAEVFVEDTPEGISEEQGTSLPGETGIPKRTRIGSSSGASGSTKTSWWTFFWAVLAIFLLLFLAFIVVFQPDFITDKYPLIETPLHNGYL